MKRVCVDIQQAALWITTISLANTRALSYTVTKKHIWTYPTVMRLLFLFGSVAFEGFISHPHSRGVRQIFCYKRTHKFNKLSSSLFPVTAHSCSFCLQHIQSQSRSEAVCHGCSAGEMLCINLFRR